MLSGSRSFARLLVVSLFLSLPGGGLLHSAAPARQEAVRPQTPPSPQQAAERRGRGRQGNRDTAPTIYWPAGVAADPAVPTPKQFFGFEIGHHHLRHDQVVAYLREIARVSDRVTIEQYGQTHGGRPLLLLTITSPENHARLNEIQRRQRQLARPRTPELPDLSGLPVVVNMGYGVHGDEPSATNTAPLVAHYLAAAQGAEIENTLEHCVILLDPSLNPDGFDRFARWANAWRGRVPNPDPAHIEHNQGWPAGRVNYYWFDLNRDWLPLQHPESQSRMRWYHRWKPNVVLDFHEMGTNSTFFFQPGIPERRNPLTPLKNVELTRQMGQFHANALDRAGSLYFTQEVFDDFYMGKGSTYPDLHGSVGILFEQGSSRGHVQESVNGIVQFSDTIRNQFTVSLSSLQGATALREELLAYQHEFYLEARQQARQARVKAWAFSLPGNRTRLQAFADILLRHDIECYWLQEDSIVDGQVLTAGSLLVPCDQWEYRFLRSLTERRRQFRESIFYDVSAWTLPLAFNLKQRGLSGQNLSPPGSFRRSLNLVQARVGMRRGNRGNPAAGNSDPAEPRQAESGDPVAWFIDWRDDAATGVLPQLLSRDVHVRVALRPLTVEANGREKSFPTGTLSIPLGIPQNQAKRRQIRQIVNRARQQGVPVDAVTSGLATTGIDLGSNNFPRVQPRSVALLVGPGVSAYQSGAVWHQLDHRCRMPVSLIPVSRVGNTDFSRYTTLVLVNGRYDLQAGDVDRLRRFVDDGGTLIALSGGTAFAQRQILQLPPAEVGDISEVVEPKNGETETPKFSEARRRAALNLVSGAIFETEIDTTHPLMFGFESTRLPVFRGSTSLLTAANPQVSNPARYTSEPLLAGYASPENQQKIAGTSAVTVHSRGRGQVILMIDDPNFRAFWPATSRVFMNAVFFGPFATAR
jgi:hypothetical protein